MVNSGRRFKLAILASHPVQYYTSLFKALASRPEIDLAVYFCMDWGAREYLDPEFGIKVKWDTQPLAGYPYTLLKNFSPVPATDRSFFGLINPGIIPELLRRRFDAVIIPGYALLSYWLGYCGAWLSGTPVLFRGDSVLRPDQPPWIRWPKKTALSMLFRGTAAFLTLGSPSRGFYSSFGIPDEKMFFSPLTVDNDFFAQECSRHKIEREKLKSDLRLNGIPVILFVGKLVDRKRPQDLLTAYRTVEKEAGLVFVGEGPLRPELEREVRNSGFSRVVFVGFKNQTELPAYYAMADLFVLPSDAGGEVSPLAIQEAMCSGLPLLISEAIPSSVDMVHPGVNGYLFPPRDTARLGQLLHLLVADESGRKTAGVRSQEIIGRWSVPQAVEGIVAAMATIRPCGK